MISISNFIKTILSYQDIAIEKVDIGPDRQGDMVISAFLFMLGSTREHHISVLCVAKNVQDMILAQKRGFGVRMT